MSNQRSIVASAFNQRMSQASRLWADLRAEFDAQELAKFEEVVAAVRDAVASGASPEDIVMMVREAYEPDDFDPPEDRD